MPKNVGFRVTGMYLGSKLSVTGEIRVDVEKENPTVYDVMVEVVRKAATDGIPGVKGFVFDPPYPTATDSLNSMTVEYSLPPKTPYEAGVYFLQENKMGNPVYVFQYYIFDENFVQKTNNNKSANFNDVPDVPILDNYTIIWRQVAIMQGKNGRSRVISEMAKNMKTMRDREKF